MKNKIIILLIFIVNIVIALPSFAQKDVIDNLKSGMTIKCKGKIISGSIDAYKEVTDYYKYENGKIYSKNLLYMFGDITKPARKVKKLKITDDYITFKDRLYKFEGFYYKWVQINRHSGQYLLNAKNDFGFFFKRANVEGVCSIENN